MPEHKIDLPNYITEIIIRNFQKMRNKPLPNCPFWRKEISCNSPELAELCKKYQLELIGVKQLLKKFDGDIIVKFYLESKRTGFKGLKKVNQVKILEALKAMQEKKNQPAQLSIDFSQEKSPEPEKRPQKIYTSSKQGKISL